MTETRVCRVCGVERPLTEFRLKGSGERRVWRCRVCQRIVSRKYGATYRARHGDQERERWTRNAQTPKQRARWTLRHAVQDGRVVKPDACSSCGTVGPVHGHHADYDAPLDVQWLCRLCHEELHRRLRQERVA